MINGRLLPHFLASVALLAAAAPAVAEPLYERFCAALDARRGVFGADMAVSLVNDGPVTLLLESR